MEQIGAYRIFGVDFVVNRATQWQQFASMRLQAVPLPPGYPLDPCARQSSAAVTPTSTAGAEQEGKNAQADATQWWSFWILLYLSTVNHGGFTSHRPRTGPALIVRFGGTRHITRSRVFFGAD